MGLRPNGAAAGAPDEPEASTTDAEDAREKGVEEAVPEEEEEEDHREEEKRGRNCAR